MEEQENNKNLNQDQIGEVSQPTSSKNRLFLASGLVAVLTLLLVTAGYKYFQHNQSGVLGKYEAVKAKPKVTPVKAKTAVKVEKVEIKSVSELEKYLKELDSYTTASLETDLQANIKESSEL